MNAIIFVKKLRFWTIFADFSEIILSGTVSIIKKLRRFFCWNKNKWRGYCRMKERKIQILTPLDLQHRIVNLVTMKFYLIPALLRVTSFFFSRCSLKQVRFTVERALEKLETARVIYAVQFFKSSNFRCLSFLPRMSHVMRLNILSHAKMMS